MRLKLTALGLFVLMSAALVFSVNAQSPTVEWTSWNAQITAHADSSQLDVAETQIIKVTGGTLNAGERDYSQPVNIQNVYLAVNGGQPKQLTQGTGPNQYQVSGSGDNIALTYQLPNPANSGDSFVVQVNYTVPAATTGLIDWFVVPADHPFPVDSSTTTINFPQGQAPSTDFVRLNQTNASVTAQGSSIVIKSSGVIAANQAFEVQVPYGAGVGQPGTSGNTTTNTNPVNSPVQTVPTDGTSADTGGGLGTILAVLCGLGLLVLLGGRSLLGGLLGGIGGGLFGGGNSGYGGGVYPTSPNEPFGGSPTQGPVRGFRESPNQNREIPTINSDKRSGGGAHFH